MYFGPFPAFLRIPLNYIYPTGRGYWSRTSAFCAGLIALVAFGGLIRIALRSSQLSLGWRNALGNTCLIGFAFGSPLLLLVANPSLYHEAIIWGLAWSLAALYFALQSREMEGAALTGSLLAFSFFARRSVAVAGDVRRTVSFDCVASCSSLIPAESTCNLAALFLPLGVAFLFYLFLSYAKFGHFSGMPLGYSINPAQRDFAVKHGVFRLERVPYSFADYFILVTLTFNALLHS